LLFGGYDTEKYTGSLVAFSVVQIALVPVLAVPFSSISITDPYGATTKPDIFPTSVGVVLDSGTPISALPPAIFTAVAEYITNLGYKVQEIKPTEFSVDCALGRSPGSLNLGFEDSSTGASTIIAVPFSEMAIPVEGGCVFGAYPQNQQPLIFGDTFMRSAYIVYDMDNNIIALAQSSFNAAGSNIVPIV